MGYSDETWYVGSTRDKHYHVVCHHQMCILERSLIGYKNKDKYPEFCMGYSDVDIITLKYHPVK